VGADTALIPSLDRVNTKQIKLEARGAELVIQQLIERLVMKPCLARFHNHSYV